MRCLLLQTNNHQTDNMTLQLQKHLELNPENVIHLSFLKLTRFSSSLLPTFIAYKSREILLYQLSYTMSKQRCGFQYSFHCLLQELIASINLLDCTNLDFKSRK